MNNKYHYLFFSVVTIVLTASAAMAPQNANAPVLIPRILRAIPHDPSAFVQGLVYANNVLYESNGLYNKSSLRIINASSGSTIKSLMVPGVFAEGLTVMKNQLVQLTWREQVALRYDLQGNPHGTYTYTGEGWGITTIKNNYVMSNGSDTLYFRDSGFTVIKKIAVTDCHRPLKNLNELEFVNGTIYANIWYDNRIAAIDPKNGAVTAFLDCGTLVRRANVQTEGAVLNGIAFNPRTKTFFITGKLWPVIFEVSIDR